MAEQAELTAPFLITGRGPGGGPSKIRSFLIKQGERIFGLRRCQALYSEIDNDCGVQEFSRQALEKIGVGIRCEQENIHRIPRTGPCLLIANHPHGGIDGLALILLVSQIRTDFKIMGNFLLGRIPQLRNNLILVDPFGGDAAARKNIAPLRQALECLRQGQLLILFPAGEVSSWRRDLGEVSDPVWSPTLARLARMSKAPVVPVFLPGGNGPLFQLAGLVHSALRTVLLPMMLLRQRGRIIEPVVGHPISAKKLTDLNDDRQLTDYLRLRTYALKNSGRNNPQHREMKEQQDRIVAGVPAQTLEKEIAALPEEHKLLESGDFEVFYAASTQVPGLLMEIGRLREITFREVGEGTGKTIDLDRFDCHYLHMFIWNRQQRELVGAYRLGQVDKILRDSGPGGLYTTTLFRFRPELLSRLKNSLELGRSFIRSEYQRSYAPLLLLWKGIGHYLAAHPHYRYLFGPVSISNEYSLNSRQLMTSALAHHYHLRELSRLVSARVPVGIRKLKISGIAALQSDPLLQDIDNISALVADFEPDGKGMPVLLRHYLSLGGKLLAFNLDPDFSDVIDGLLLVDLLASDTKQLQRYMGKDGYAEYLRYQQGRLESCA